MSGRSASSMPATEWIRVTSSASAIESGGRIPGSRRASIVFPVPGGPAKRRLWPPGGGDLEGAASPLLAAHVGEIEQRLLRRRVPVALDVRLGLALAAQIGGGLGEMVERHRLDAGERRLGRGARRAEDPGQAGPARRLRKGNRTTDRPQPPVERKLADGGVLGKPVARDLPGGGEDRERDREIEARALLAQAGGREVDGDPALRPLELRRGDSAAHALLRLLAGAVGEPDDRERRHRALEVRLDLDAACVEPDERMRDRPRQHVPRLGWGRAPVCHARRAGSVKSFSCSWSARSSPRSPARLRLPSRSRRRATTRSAPPPEATGSSWSRSRQRGSARSTSSPSTRTDPAFRVNRKGTQAYGGGIDGTRLLYQLIRGQFANQSDLRLFDLQTRRLKSLPAGSQHEELGVLRDDLRRLDPLQPRARLRPRDAADPPRATSSPASSARSTACATATASSAPGRSTGTTRCGPAATRTRSAPSTATT